MSNSFSAHTSTKLFVLTIILAFAGFLTLTTSSALAFSGAGTGITTDPYQITNIEQLYEINDDLTASYELMNDLDFCDPASYDDPNNGTSSLANYCEDQGATAGWDMIGDREGSDIYNFSGNLDGGEHVIKNLYINRDNFGVGFISAMKIGIVENIGFEDVKIVGGTGSVGIIAGAAEETENLEQNIIRNTYVTGSVETKSGADGVGGLIGFAQDVDIIDSYANALVSDAGGSYIAGGLIGVVEKTETISEQSDINKINIVNSYVNGKVTTSVSDKQYSHGVIGWKYFNDNSAIDITYDGTFWDTQSTLQSKGSEDSPTAELVGKTTQEMFAFDTFKNDWDIAKVGSHTTETWKINDGEDYPRLGWQSDDIQHGGYTIITPATAKTVTEKEISFTAEAYDENGNLITDTVGDFTWSGDGSSGAIEAAEPGVYSLIATYPDSGKASQAEITVEWGIYSIEDLYEIGDHADGDDLITQTYRLQNDLDFCDSASYESPDTGTTSLSNYCKAEGATTGWDMWSQANEPYFVGEFYGDEHVIKNLYINRNGVWGNALFQFAGHNDYDTVIKDLGVIDAEVTTDTGGTGILIGENIHYKYGSAVNGVPSDPNSGSMTIEKVFTTGGVSSSGYGVGGMIGAGGSVAMSNSYSTASVEGGGSPAAGLYGAMWGELDQLKNSYSVGFISTSSNSDGFAADDSGGDVVDEQYSGYENNFFDIQTTGQAGTSPIATGKTTAEMQSLTTFTDVATEGLDSSWSIATIDNYTDETWVIDDGNAYPQLAWYAIDEEEEEEESSSGGSSGGGGGLLVRVSPSGGDYQNDEEEEEVDEDNAGDEDQSAGGGGGGSSDSDDDEESDESDDTDEGDDSDDEDDDEESEEDEANEQESQEFSPSERISRLVQDVSQLQQDQNMTREEKITRLRDILLDLVDILSGSLQ